MVSNAAASNEQTIFNYFDRFFLGKGFSAQQAEIAAAGVTGNAQIESSFSPTSYNSREGAQGIFQWEGGRGDTGALGSYARSTGGSVTNLQTQLGFAAQEVNGPYSRVIAQLKSAANPQQAAYAWASIFEGNTPVSDPARESAADTIYAQITGGHPLTGGGVNPGTGTAGSGAQGAIDTSFLSGSAPGGNWDPLNWIGDLGGSVTSAVGSQITSAFETILKDVAAPFVRFAADALLVIVGIVLVVVAFKMIADSSGENSAPSDDPDVAEQESADSAETESDAHQAHEHQGAGAAQTAEAAAAE